jgi:hypothetical protein
MTKRTIVIAGLLTCGVAAAEDKGQMPKPAAEMDQMKLFLGSWKCEGKMMAGPWAPGVPEHAVKAKVTAKPDLGGFWQSFVYEEQKTKEHPMAAKVMGSWGWDAAAKRFVRADRDSMGGWFAPTSSGWEGDKFVWTGDLDSPMGKMPAKHTFTKKSDKEFTHTLDLTAGGKESRLFEVTCKK